MSTLPTSFAGRCRRALRHLLTGSASGKRCFPPATLAAIEQAIGEGEKLHRAEVRLIVEAALDAGAAFRNVSNRERARTLFAQYGIWDTEENCGVLIYVNLAAHEVDIVADRNVGRQVPEQDWQAICGTMTQGFAQGDFHHSTLAALQQLNDILHKLFPADGTRPNQLPNDALIL
ncbi:TPM domain-containing protein [Massilia sp. erpn]|uniref:TPM domain-containing protein n=1 Tax=Massilia sp. erpn TaxID=2738142 RepID=UPI00210232DE|nr:TPM domain-containing protein [Massilia sp. erpn]UTY56019.1 TPM domain-containing protein [Massilia sp. erpn]